MLFPHCTEYSRESLQLFGKTLGKLVKTEFLISKGKGLLDYEKKKIFCEAWVSVGCSKKEGGRCTDSKKEDRGATLHRNLIQSRIGGDESEGILLN